jgi:hypothetical protein
MDALCHGMASAESGRVAPPTHRAREVVMRLVACLTVCVIPVVANAAQTESQPSSDPQAYCVNRNADFYPYTGEPCKSGAPIAAF